MSNSVVITEIPFPNSMELAKRTYLPFKISAPCPDCGVVETVDLTDQYLSYPSLGINSITFSHPNAEDDEESCQNVWEVEVILEFKLTAV